MIAINQVRAARSLLGITQKELAKLSGVSLASIANLEQGKGKKQGKAMTSVQQALEQAGIEFTPEPGVRLCQEKFGFRVLEGHDSLFELWDDIILALGQTGGEVLMSGISDSVWLEKYKEDLASALKRQRDHKIFTRILVSEEETVVLIGPEPYRSVPNVLFQQTPTLVYADRFAIINWGPPQRILLVQNSLISETFRRQFDYNYNLGKRLKTDNLVVVKMEGLPYLP